MVQNDKSIPVSLVVSDPWEVESDNGTSSFSAVVETLGENVALLRVPIGLILDGNRFEYFLCRARYEGTTIADVLAGHDVHCNLKAVPVNKLSEARELDDSWWRGSGMIGTLRRTS